MSQSTIQQTFDLALQHHQAGQLQEAEQLYRQVLALKPDFPEAYFNLGIALKGKGQLDEAIAAFRQAVVLRPNYAEAYNNLGNALRDKGQIDEAIAALGKARFLRPDSAEVHNNFGNALKEKGQLDEAIVAYRQAITLKPGYAEAHSNLGNTLGDKGQLDDAIAAYRRAIALNPNLAEAYSNLGTVLNDTGQLDETIAVFRRAIAINPGFAAAHSALVFSLRYHPAYNAGLIAEEERRWNRRHAEPLRKLIQPPSTSSGQAHTNNRDPDRHLRIGYVSADFRMHASANFLAPLLEHHDPRQVELFCYAQVLRPDEMTDRMRRRATQWRSTIELSDAQMAESIREDRIDILVDLKLHTGDNRLLVFARKPAPVQVTWLGYPGSTGMSTIDYRLTDPYLDPPGLNDHFYSETSFRLPDSFWCYDPLENQDIAVNSLPALQTGVVTFGCLNNFCKINDQVLQLWAQVLKSVDRSRLQILCPEGSHRQPLLDLLQREGIHLDRIELVGRRPRAQYLELYHRIDVGLDTFPYNGHTTSLDSFWMGVPVVTLVGLTVVGRAGLSQLSNLGLTELIAHTPQQYVQIAAALAGDLPRLSELRRTLRSRMQASPLMDAAKFARNIETAYRQMWRTWCRTASARNEPAV